MLCCHHIHEKQSKKRKNFQGNYFVLFTCVTVKKTFRRKTFQENCFFLTFFFHAWNKVKTFSQNNKNGTKKWGFMYYFSCVEWSEKKFKIIFVMLRYQVKEHFRNIKNFFRVCYKFKTKISHVKQKIKHFMSCVKITGYFFYVWNPVSPFFSFFFVTRLYKRKKKFLHLFSRRKKSELSFTWLHTQLN